MIKIVIEMLRFRRTPISRKMTSRTHDCSSRTKPNAWSRDRNRPMKIKQKW